MITFIIIVHILVSLGLILVVLLQTGKGAEMGAVFGGGSSATIFGSSGAGNFLTRMTTGMAIVFMITSLTLGYFSGKGGSTTVFDRAVPEAPAPSEPSSAPIEVKPGPQTAPAEAKPETPPAPAAESKPPSGSPGS